MRRAILAAVVAAVALAGCSRTPSSSDSLEADTASTRTTIEQARDACIDVGELADDGHTIIFDTQGEDEFDGDSYENVACVLVELDMPESVAAKMDNTRALDGTLSAEWDGLEASWTYHPDDGISLIVTEVD